MATGWAYGAPHLDHNYVYRNIGGTLEATASWQSDDTYDHQGALWTDADDDGWLDLVMIAARAETRIYRNLGGVLETTASWETSDSLGQDGIMVAAALGRDLEEEAPADVKRLDLMILDVGLEQTDLTDKEIAVKVVRSFLQALIAKDYDRAIKIYGYEDPDEKEELLKRFEKLNIVRIISVGDPVYPRLASRGQLEVPCKVELEEDGQIIEWQIEGVFAQRVIGHPNRWRVKGEFEK